jgi:hypothetical protein
MGQPTIGRFVRKSLGRHEARRASTVRRWRALGLAALTLACFALAVFIPIFVIPALFLSAWLVNVVGWPWQWLLIFAVVLLGVTAIAPSFGGQALSDDLGVIAYSLAVVAVSAGLIETLGERRSSGRRSDRARQQPRDTTPTPQASSDPDGTSDGDEQEISQVRARPPG